MIKILVFDNKIAVPLNEVVSFREGIMSDTPGKVTLVDTKDDRTLIAAKPLWHFMKSLHGFQRSNDATFQNHYSNPEQYDD